MIFITERNKNFPTAEFKQKAGIGDLNLLGEEFKFMDIKNLFPEVSFYIKKFFK